MHITFSPIRADTALALHRNGDTLTIAGQYFDFTALEKGATLPRGAVDCPWLAGDVTRAEGLLQIPLLLPHGQDAGQDALFPAPVTAGEGPVDAPGHPGGEAMAEVEGAIDWAAMIQPEALLAAARADGHRRMLDWIAGFLARFTEGVPLTEVQSWPVKAERARAHLASPPDPSIVMEATVNGEDPDTLARRILEKAEQFTMITAATTGLRRATERAIDAADSPEAVEAALQAALGQAQVLMNQLGIEA